MHKTIPLNVAPRVILEPYKDECEKRLIEMLNDGYEMPDWRRAGGDVICQQCRKPYYEHPHHDPILWLHILCDKRLVKL